MELYRSHLQKGIDLTSARTDKFKTGTFCVSVIIPKTLKNNAHDLVLAGVLRRGTKKLPDMASINRRLDELYASTLEIRSSRIGNDLMLVIGSEILDERYVAEDIDILDGIIEIIFDTLFNPLFTEESFDTKKIEQERDFVKDAINAEKSNPRAYSFGRCREIMHRKDPEYPSFERIYDAVSEISRDSLLSFYKEVILNAPMDIFYLGGMSHEEVKEKIERALGRFCDLGARPIESSSVLSCPSPELPDEFTSKTEKMPVVQGKLTMGMRTGSGFSTSNYHTALLLNEIFGASPLSKLFMNVREKLGLCYYCSSTFDIFSGALMVSSGINVNNREKVEAAILEQFDEIRNGNISDAEFMAAKRSLENSYRQINDNPFDIQSFYNTRKLFGSNETIEKCISSILSVTREEVIALAKATVCDTVFFVEGTLDGGEDSDYE